MICLSSIGIFPSPYLKLKFVVSVSRRLIHPPPNFLRSPPGRVFHTHGCQHKTPKAPVGVKMASKPGDVATGYVNGMALKNHGISMKNPLRSKEIWDPIDPMADIPHPNCPKKSHDLFQRNGFFASYPPTKNPQLLSHWREESC